MQRWLAMLVASGGIFWSTVLSAATIPNAEFREGSDAPSHWSLSGGQGRWVDRERLEVVGTGSDSHHWRSDEVSLEPGECYRFQFRVRRHGGSGTVIAGPTRVNRDYRQATADWQWLGHVFRALGERDTLRLGQWQSTGAIEFDAVRLARVVPVHRRVGGLLLGSGELIRAGEYQFLGSFGHEGSNDHRTLESATASFNSDRWMFGGGDQITYRFALPGHSFSKAWLEFAVNYHTRGGCIAEASGDGQAWHELTHQDGLGTGQAALPAELLPSGSLLVRLRATEGSSFQINQVDFRAKLDSPVPDAFGETLYANVESDWPGVTLGPSELDRDAMGREVLRLALRNSTTRRLAGRAQIARTVSETTTEESRSWSADPQSDASLVIPWSAAPGEQELVARLTTDSQAATGEYRVALRWRQPDFYRGDYGAMLAGLGGDTAVWWCPATHKVPRGRALPEAQSAAAELAAARNDREAVQIVIRPKEALRGLTARAGALVGPEGATIPAGNVQVLRVYYHFVHHPTDATGLRDWWPDALPPLDAPLDIEAGQNQPLWVLVHVPADAQPGQYNGEVHLAAEGFEARVPLRLRVWNFALPERNHVETAFGLSPGAIFQYHNLKTEEDKRQVLDLYFRSFAEHRISPYDPAPLDPIGVKFLPDAQPPRAEVDFAGFDEAMDRAVRDYGFTSFRLHVQGMGGGTFHDRVDPKIGPYAADTPQYQGAFASYLKQIEAHLGQRGWLDMAYVYWFDEPDPKDYAFVRAGMERLKREAPGLRTMLTEEPVEALAGPIDIWCPVTPNFNVDEAAKRRLHGERFWWYVCTGPKAPYCTLFIDHPATELRVWLWQTWQRDVRGVLVWASNYWSSSAAFPDGHQDPYEDPMGYVSGYSTPAGTRRYWGNGDGRFLYPPLAASTPGKAKGSVIAPPVSSIRWEMLREGIEDYEMLHLLRDLLAERRGGLKPDEIRRFETLLEVPAGITQDMTTFTTNPAPIYARRALVAEAIEQLTP